MTNRHDFDGTVTADGVPYPCHATVRRRPTARAVKTTAFGHGGRERRSETSEGWGGELKLGVDAAWAVWDAQQRTLNGKDIHVENDSDPDHGLLRVSGTGEPPTGY